MSELSLAIEDALRSADLVQASTDVKDLVCSELNKVDPKVEIHRTDYFNHTFVPDIVLDWNDGIRREVFLRFLEPELMFEDLERIGVDGPILFDIGASSRSAEFVSDGAASRTVLERFGNVMMTNSEATAEIRPERATNVIMNIVTSNVLKSGRGEYRESDVRELLSTAQSGFDGVEALNSESVAAAIRLVEQRFDPGFEVRIERFLQLLWWANGGQSEAFPLSSLDDLSLNAIDTEDFLRSVLRGDYVINSESFWSRLADRISFDLLVGTGPIFQSHNLELLMKHLSRRMKLSHASMDLVARPFPPDDVWHWSISDKFLTFSGADLKCQFTPLGNRFSQRHGEGLPITLREAKARSNDIRIEGAELHESSRLVMLTRLEDDATDDSFDSLNSLTSGFDEMDLVQKIMVRARESEITVDFDRMLLSSNPDSTVFTLANLAFSVLATVNPDDLPALTLALDLDS